MSGVLLCVVLIGRTTTVPFTNGRERSRAGTDGHPTGNMPDAQPAPVGGPLPRGYLLALNRSFRRTLEAENKSPRTVEAYTDAVRFLALSARHTASRSSPASDDASTSRASSPTSSLAGSGDRPQPLRSLHALSEPPLLAATQELVRRPGRSVAPGRGGRPGGTVAGSGPAGRPRSCPGRRRG